MKYRRTVLLGTNKGEKKTYTLSCFDYCNVLGELINFIKTHKLDEKLNISPDALSKMKRPEAEKIVRENFKKKFVVDELAHERGFRVLRLPPYHCVLNPIEIAWSQAKYWTRKLNATPGINESVVETLTKVFDDITPAYWKKIVDHVKREVEPRFINIHTADSRPRCTINFRNADESEDSGDSSSTCGSSFTSDSD
jgi:transposase